MNRREFIESVFRAGGIVALASLGLSPAEIKAFTFAGGTFSGGQFGSGSSGGSCDTEVLSNTAAEATTYDITDSDNYYYVGHHFINFASAHDICKVRFYLTKTLGSITGKTYTAYIFTIDGSGNLTNVGTPVATSSGVTGVDTWDDTAVDFEFSTAASLSASTNYATVLSTGSVDASNVAAMGFSASGQIDGLYGRWTSDGTRQSSGSYDAKIVMYEA